MHPVGFGADGIRAIAGEWPLDAVGVARIASALGRFVMARSSHPVVIIGRDTRPSGAWLASDLEAGLLRQGADVISLGVMTTPGVAYLARRLGAVLGISVSASHNPVDYNGIKLVGFNGLRLQREDEMEIESLVERAHAGDSGRSDLGAASVAQQTNAEHLIEIYIRDHVQHCPAPSLGGLRLVLDCANGAAARVAPEAFTRLGAEIAVINNDMIGTAINHLSGSEHARRHPEHLIEVVRQYGAVYGFAFDGDGDRLVVVDSDGCLYDGDDLLFSLATHFHSQGTLRGSAVVTTDAANSGLKRALGRRGIEVVPSGKGDRAVEAAMWHGDYLVGGEQTGNIIINDGHHTAADAVYTALVLAGILHDQGASLGEMTASFEKFPQVLASAYLRATPPLEHLPAVEQQREALSASLGSGCRIVAWYSSTEPGWFKVMIEGGTHNSIQQIREAALSICRTTQLATQSEEVPMSVFELSTRSWA